MGLLRLPAIRVRRKFSELNRSSLRDKQRDNSGGGGGGINEVNVA